MKLGYYRVNTKLLKSILNSSVFQNYTNSIIGPVLVIYSQEDEYQVNFKVLLNFLNESKIYVFGVYLDYNVYSLNQVLRLSYLNKYKNASLLYLSLSNFLKLPCSKFINKVFP